MLVTFFVVCLAIGTYGKPTGVPDLSHSCLNMTWACHDLGVAKRCDKFTSCIEIWEKIKAPEDNNEICDICKDMVKQARDQLLSNETQEEMKEVFEGSCNLLPIKAVAAECRKVVDEIVPELIEMLASRMDPNTVCTVAGLCNNGLLTKLLKEQYIMSIPLIVPEAPKADCDTCKDGMKFTDFVGVLLNACVNGFKGSLPQCLKMISRLMPTLENMKIMADGSCDKCLMAVAAVQDELRNPELKTEITNDMLVLCSKTGELKSVCDSFVSQYFGMIYDDFVNKILDPNFLCKTIKMCPNQAIKSEVNQAVCHVCRVYSIVTPSIKDSLFESIEDSAVNHLKKMCLTTFNMYDLQSCQEFMKEIGPVIYNFLKVVGPDTFCGQMSVCPPIKPIIAGVGDNMTCEFCESLVQYVQNIVSSKTTKEEFRTAMTNFCAELKEFSDQCKNLVDEYFDQFYDFLVKNLDPPVVCGALGLCNGQLSLVKTVPARKIEFHPEVQITPRNSPSKIFRAIPMSAARPPQSTMPGVKIQPALNARENKYKKYMLEQNSLTPVTESNSINEIDGPALQQLPVDRFMHPSLPGAGMNCEVCKSVVAYVEHELKDPKEEDQIRKVLDEVCNVLPKEVQNQCLDFIDTNIDYLISMILKEASPEVICAFLKACPSQDQSSNNFLPCEICRKVMQYLEKELENNKTEEAIKAALDKACTYMPKSWGKKCTDFVDKYTDMIIDLLAHEVAPTMVCAALGLCPMEPKVEGEVECTVCQYVLHYLQEQLMDNATEDEIKKELEKVCTVMPKSLADNCNAFVEEFGNSLLVLLAQKLDPSVVCVNFKLCPGKGVFAHHSVASETIKSLKLDTCSTCQMVVDYMDKLLENDNIDTEITKLIEKICNVIPLAARDQCASLIETYGPFVLQMIGQLSNSKEVCQAIDLCSRNSGHVQLLGGEKCTYGPSYWCQSSAHASACNAEPFCKQQVWKD